MELEQIRAQINALNEELLRLFEKRMRLCGQDVYKRQVRILPRQIGSQPL